MDKQTQEKNENNIMRDCFSRFGCWLGLIQKNSYVFTVLFFLIALGASVFIWWTCIYPADPSPEARDKFYQQKENFDQMSQKIDRVIKELQEKEKNFSAPPDLEGQREIFKQLALPEQPEAEKENAGSVQ